VPYIGHADFDRPISFGSGYLYHSYGGGAFRLAPFGCSVRTAASGQVDFQLDVIRALDERDARATLLCTLGSVYASEEALTRVREISAGASVTSCVLTDWWFRALPSAALGAPADLAAPAIIAGDGLGTARVMASLSIGTGLILESMLKSGTPLQGVAEATILGLSPRLPVIVLFESAELMAELVKRADASGALPRQAIEDYFNQDPSALPLRLDGILEDAALPRFAGAMTDRVVARYGRYVPAQVMADSPVVQLDASAAGSSTRWALTQPFVASRRVVMPVDLLAAAQAQVERLGPDSVIRRTTLTSLPSFGQTRVTALCNLPLSRAGVEAVGVTLTFPPHPPARPQPQIVTAVFESGDDTAALDVRLSPDEPVRYRYSSFAVVTDEIGTRQIDAPEIDGEGSPLHLSTDRFPIEFAVIEVTPALGELAVVSGACTYELDGLAHEQRFMLDSGSLSVAIAIARQRSSLTIDGYAIARDGSGQLRIGHLDLPQVRLDLTSFPDARRLQFRPSQTGAATQEKREHGYRSGCAGVGDRARGDSSGFRRHRSRSLRQPQ
jgi:hypothetical protein